MFSRIIAGWVSRKLADKQAELDAANRLIAIQAVEIAGLAAVVARNRERVIAETAEASRRVADAESIPGKR